MSERDIGERIRDAFDAVQKDAPPPFDAVWSAAEQQHHKARRRQATFGGIAAALVLVVVSFWLFNRPHSDDEYLIAESLLNETQWSAPSDTLMPIHEIDIYQEIPFLAEPTNPDEGLFL